MLRAACEQFLGKTSRQIMNIAKETLEGHQRAIMCTMSVEVQLTIMLLVVIELYHFILSCFNSNQKYYLSLFVKILIFFSIYVNRTYFLIVL